MKHRHSASGRSGISRTTRCIRRYSIRKCAPSHVCAGRAVGSRPKARWPRQSVRWFHCLFHQPEEAGPIRWRTTPQGRQRPVLRGPYIYNRRRLETPASRVFYPLRSLCLHAVRAGWPQLRVTPVIDLQPSTSGWSPRRFALRTPDFAPCRDQSWSYLVPRLDFG